MKRLSLICLTLSGSSPFKEQSSTDSCPLNGPRMHCCDTSFNSCGVAEKGTIVSITMQFKIPRAQPATGTTANAQFASGFGGDIAKSLRVTADRVVLIKITIE